MSVHDYLFIPVQKENWESRHIALRRYLNREVCEEDLHGTVYQTLLKWYWQWCVFHRYFKIFDLKIDSIEEDRFYKWLKKVKLDFTLEHSSNHAGKYPMSYYVFKSNRCKFRIAFFKTIGAKLLRPKDMFVTRSRRILQTWLQLKMA